MRGAQASLPLAREEMPEGLTYAPDLIDADEERALIADIEALDLPHFVFQRWTSRRRARSFGYSYDFQGGRFAEGAPIPDFLLPLKVRAASFAGVPDDTVVQASVIAYEPGAAIGWHRDRPELGTVIGVSLGGAAIMRFRRRLPGRTERAAASLAPRSVYHLAGEVRDEWEHSLPPAIDARWSVTFRGLTPRGKARLARPSQATVAALART